MNKKRNKEGVQFKKRELVLATAYRVSDLIRNVCGKLLPPFKGPYIIVKII